MLAGVARRLPSGRTAADGPADAGFRLSGCGLDRCGTRALLRYTGPAGKRSVPLWSTAFSVWRKAGYAGGIVSAAVDGIGARKKYGSSTNRMERIDPERQSISFETGLHKPCDADLRFLRGMAFRLCLSFYRFYLCRLFGHACPQLCPKGFVIWNMMSRKRAMNGFDMQGDPARSSNPFFLLLPGGKLHDREKPLFAAMRGSEGLPKAPFPLKGKGLVKNTA